MNEKNKAILAEFVGTKKRSQLTPHRELICKLHQRGCTFREIVRILSENFSLTVAHTTVIRFVAQLEQEIARVRKTKPRKRKPVTIMPVTPTAKVKSIPVAVSSPDEVRQKITALKQQTEQTEPYSKRFNYAQSLLSVSTPTISTTENHHLEPSSSQTARTSLSPKNRMEILFIYYSFPYQTPHAHQQ